MPVPELEPNMTSDSIEQNLLHLITESLQINMRPATCPMTTDQVVRFCEENLLTAREIVDHLMTRNRYAKKLALDTIEIFEEKLNQLKGIVYRYEMHPLE